MDVEEAVNANLASLRSAQENATGDTSESLSMAAEKFVNANLVNLLNVHATADGVERFDTNTDVASSVNVNLVDRQNVQNDVIGVRSAATGREPRVFEVVDANHAVRLYVQNTVNTARS